MKLHRLDRHGGGSRRGRLIALLAVPLLAAPLLAAAASPDRDGLDGSSPGVLAVPDRAVGVAKTVTLITGDRVTVQPDGRAIVQPAEGREDMSFSVSDGDPDEVSVMPVDAGQLVSDGRLDEQLFDVSYLIEQGYDDASQDELPLLFEGNVHQIRGMTADVASAELTDEMPTLGISAVTQDRDGAAQATELWSELRDADAAAGPGARDRGSPASWWPEGVEKVWLDAKAHVTLDESVPQVGAPQAWEAGYTGEGVTVAVLDSGIDGEHPDLAGRITAAENFTTEDSPADGHGHGTHVASTIAGSGAASDGTYTGVAPGAELMNGKVCTSSGSCPNSGVLAGMEWAAVNGADVINMSLGSVPTDGTDLLSQEVNTLTDEHDVLFVIAAGNDGPGNRTVSAPGTADAALTVGAVDKSDQIADFSSRGPRFGDYAMKPDIAAPGVSIRAARATTTGYTEMSGTSMAAPHVAGGAAILAQQHPDWSPEQLKAGLMSTATPLEALRPFDIGAGRLDLARAVTQTVTTKAPSVSFGRIEYPYDIPAVTKPVTYRNDGDAPVTLNLDLSAADQNGDPTPDGLFALTATEVTVPAGGEANVDLTMTPNGTGSGTYSGRLTATSADGTVAVQTVFGVYLEPEHHNLTINLLDRDGQPATAPAVMILNYDTGESLSGSVDGGRVSLRLPEGAYGVIGLTRTHSFAETPPDGGQNQYAVMTYPELQLSDQTEVTLDAREARKIEFRAVDRPTARVRHGSGVVRMVADTGRVRGFMIGAGDAAGGTDHYIGSVGPAGDNFRTSLQAELTEPLVRLDVNGAPGLAVDVFYADREGTTRPRTPLLGTHQMDVVHGGSGTASELDAVDVAGNLVVLDLPPERDSELLAAIGNVKRAGGRAVLLDRYAGHQPCLDRSNGNYCADWVFGSDDAAPELPVLMAPSPGRHQLLEMVHAGEVTVTTRGIKSSPYQYNLYFPTYGVPESPVYEVKDRELGVVHADYRYTGASRYGPNRMGTYSDFGSVAWGRRGSNDEPQQRTEYYSPTPVQWFYLTTTVDDAYRPGAELFPVAGSIELRPGQRMRWEPHFEGPMGPSFAISSPSAIEPSLLNVNGRYMSQLPAWVFRDGDMMSIFVNLLEDRSSEHVVISEWHTTGHTRLYLNGELIAQNTSPRGGYTTTPLPAGAGEYRLEMAASSPGWEVSRNVEAAWTFSSAATDGPTALPLMAVRYEPKLDDWNRARAGRALSFPVRVERQDGSTDAEVTNLSIQASYDGGMTWDDARLLGRMENSEARIMLVHPPLHRTNGCVDLRATAEDADGNTVEQTIECAYQLKSTSRQDRDRSPGR